MRIFLSYAHEDKDRVLELYRKLNEDGYDAWIDDEKLLPGQNWDLEINKAIRSSDVIMLCLTNVSIAKRGYVQREMKRAIDLAQEQLDDDIFVIPARLDNCNVPDSISKWHHVDLFAKDGYQRLLTSLALKSDQISPKVIERNIGPKVQNPHYSELVKLHSIAQELYEQAYLALQENQETLTPALQRLETQEQAIQKMIGVFHRQRSRGFFANYATYLTETFDKVDPKDIEYREVVQNLLNTVNELIDIFYSPSQEMQGRFITKSEIINREVSQNIDSTDRLGFFAKYLESLRLRVEALAKIAGKLSAMNGKRR